MQMTQIKAWIMESGAEIILTLDSVDPVAIKKKTRELAANGYQFFAPSSPDGDIVTVVAVCKRIQHDDKGKKKYDQDGELKYVISYWQDWSTGMGIHPSGHFFIDSLKDVELFEANSGMKYHEMPTYPGTNMPQRDRDAKNDADEYIVPCNPFLVLRTKTPDGSKVKTRSTYVNITNVEQLAQSPAPNPAPAPAPSTPAPSPAPAPAPSMPVTPKGKPPLPEGNPPPLSRAEADKKIENITGRNASDPESEDYIGYDEYKDSDPFLKGFDEGDKGTWLTRAEIIEHYNITPNDMTVIEKMLGAAKFNTDLARGIVIRSILFGRGKFNLTECQSRTNSFLDKAKKQRDGNAKK